MKWYSMQTKVNEKMIPGQNSFVGSRYRIFSVPHQLGVGSDPYGHDKKNRSDVFFQIVGLLPIVAA